MRCKIAQYFNNKVLFFSFAKTNPAIRLTCGISLKEVGSMRLSNIHNRTLFFENLGVPLDSLYAPIQIHSKNVEIIFPTQELYNVPHTDGLVSCISNINNTQKEFATSILESTSLAHCSLSNAKKMVSYPCLSVTVADCMPIYFFDPSSGVYGLLHSGWKGTGILENALILAKKNFGLHPSTTQVIFGPHIRSCCYTVDVERANYFKREFGPDSAWLDVGQANSKWPYRLSLARANYDLAQSLGVLSENIQDTALCTSCNPIFGSHRRETAESGDFTHMAAFMHVQAVVGSESWCNAPTFRSHY